MNYLILVFSWGVYLFLHSFLALNSVKRVLKERFPFLSASYRLCYSLISIAGLLAILYLMAVLKSEWLFLPGKIAKYIGLVLATWGVIVITASFRKISGLAFLGLKKETHARLIRSGIHGKIRHPIYSGIILIFLGMLVYHPTDIVLISVVVVYVYLPIGIRLEEKKLIEMYREEYLNYKKEVPAIIPRIF